MVAAKYQHVVDIFPFDTVEVLVNGIGSSLVPVPAFLPRQVGLQQPYIPVGRHEAPRRADADMLGE